MNIAPADLLKRLASGVRPDGSVRSEAPEGLERQSFAGLLQSVRAGDIMSGRPLHQAPDLAVPLDAEQLSRLEVAADAAEAAGSTRTLALIDDVFATIDVGGRRVDATSARGDQSVITGIDGFVLVPQGRAAELRAMFAGESDRAARSASGSQGAQPGLETIRNLSVASILEAIGGADRAA